MMTMEREMRTSKTKTLSVRFDAVYVMVLVPLLAMVPHAASGKLKVERVRGFVCSPSAMGKQADIASVKKGGEKEKFFIRPADNACRFDLFYRSASGGETKVSDKPGGYLIAQAAALNAGTRVICASDAVHTAVRGGKPNERRTERVPIRCWIGSARRFKSAVTVVAEAPEYAAWVKRVEVHPTQASTYRVVWVRDFSFQFLNMSDAGRPSTDGTYETTFTLKKQNLVVGKTTKLSSSTLDSPGTIGMREITREEFEAARRRSKSVGSSASSAPLPRTARTDSVLSMTGSPVTGTIGGQAFRMDGAALRNGVLEIRRGEEFAADAKVSVFLFLKTGEFPDGKSFEVDSTSRPIVPHIHFSAKSPNASASKRGVVMSGYEMTLVFGKRNAGKLPGTIKLRLPDKYKTTLAGDFEVAVK